MTETRFDRQLPFLTRGGQARLESARIAVVGVGGLGSHVVQQLAYLGAVNLTLIDEDRVDRTNLNRLVTALPEDVGKLKVDVLHRFVAQLHPGAAIRAIPQELRSANAYEGIVQADYVIGCLDDDGPRFLLNQLAAAYTKPYLDLASEIGEDRTSYGGRVVFVRPGKGCLWCRNLLDRDEINSWLETPVERRTREHIYGQRIDPAANSGPSVVALNGIIASLGVMELMLEIAGVRSANEYLLYRGAHGLVTKPSDEPAEPGSCRICQGVAGRGDRENLVRFIHTKAKQP
jgi:molybdopterin/thiamine biosynthesis adenylyltransferase